MPKMGRWLQIAVVVIIIAAGTLIQILEDELETAIAIAASHTTQENSDG